MKNWKVKKKKTEKQKWSVAPLGFRSNQNSEIFACILLQLKYERRINYIFDKR